MDTSPRYIEMCEKAKEIQEKWIPQVGDYYWLGNRYSMTSEAVRMLCSDPLIFDFEKKEKVWLPRQEQLQEMCEPPLDILLMEFFEWLPKYFIGVVFHSFEQLWLAYVMQKKYNKIWEDSKEEWVKIENKI